MPDSNRLPLPCHGSALPIELMAQSHLCIILSFQLSSMASCGYTTPPFIRYNRGTIDKTVMRETKELCVWERKAFWKKFLFSLFLLSIPFSVRKVLVVVLPEGQVGFNEYTDISLYLSDILFLLFLVYFVLENKIAVLSISYWQRMFHVEHLMLFILAPLPFILWAGTSIFWSKSEILTIYSLWKLLEGYFLYVILILWNVPRGTSDETAEDQSNKKMFHVEHNAPLNNTERKFTAEENVPRGTLSQKWMLFIKKCSTWNTLRVIMTVMIFSGFIQSLFAIIQFLLQRSLGFTFLKESVFLASDHGIAKIILAHNGLARAYGFFPHPNVLAGFLGITILFTIAYPLVFHRKMFHVEHAEKMDTNVPRGTSVRLGTWLKEKCSTWNNISDTGTIFQKMFHVEHSLLIYRSILAVQLLAFLFTFSKSAIFWLLIAIIYIFYCMFHVEHAEKMDTNVPRGTLGGLGRRFLSICSTWNMGKKKSLAKVQMFHVEHFVPILALIIVVTGILFFFHEVDWQYFLRQPLQERLFLNQESYGVWQLSQYRGIGLGQSVLVMPDFFSEKLLWWQLQPIHNIFLLVLAETGFIGLLLFFLFFFVFFDVPRGTIYKYGKKCSTWNIWNILKKIQMFHVEHTVPLNNVETKYTGEESVPRGTFREERVLPVFLSAIILFVLGVSCFDHYFWDIQQGQILLWLSLGIFAATRIRLSIDK